MLVAIALALAILLIIISIIILIIVIVIVVVVLIVLIENSNNSRSRSQCVRTDGAGIFGQIHKLRFVVFVIFLLIYFWSNSSIFWSSSKVNVRRCNLSVKF